MENKRKDFDDTEAESFLLCLEKFQHIIENKKTDKVTNRDKQTAWFMLTDMFNGLPGVRKRDCKQLMTFYKNMKRKGNKSQSEQRIKIFKTGGGPPENPNQNPVAERLVAMGAIKTPLINIFDSDAEYHEMTTSGTTFLLNNCDQEESDEVIQIAAEGEMTEEGNSSNYETAGNPTHFEDAPVYIQSISDTPSCSKTPDRKVYKLKRAKRTTPNATPSAKTAESLIQQSELKKLILTEQHEWLREKFLRDKEKHELEMRLLNEQLKMYKTINEKIANGEEIHLCINSNK